MISYSDVLVSTFSFMQTKVDQNLFEKVWNLEYPETDNPFVKKKLMGTTEDIRLSLINFICNQDVDPYLLEGVKSFTFDINRMCKGESVPMHNEVSQKSPYEVILWLTKTDIYEGREFVMTKGGKKWSVKPCNGLMCFIDTTSTEAYHGVNELITDTAIISITGGLGRK